jgi:hypothetical protein
MLKNEMLIYKKVNEYYEDENEYDVIILNTYCSIYFLQKEMNMGNLT